MLFLVIVASIFGGSHRTVSVAGGQIDTSVCYVPGIIALGIIALGIIAAAFVNLVVTVTAQRETGVLKRRRATPVPAVAVIIGRALTAVVVALAITAVLLTIGWAAYGAHTPARTAPALIVTVVVGTVAFCCPGYALASLIRNEDAAQPITQAVMLPCTSSRASSLPSRFFPAGSSTLRTCSPYDTWPTRSWWPTARTPAGPDSPPGTYSSSQPGQWQACSSQSAGSAGCRSRTRSLDIRSTILVRRCDRRCVGLLSRVQLEV